MWHNNPMTTNTDVVKAITKLAEDMPPLRKVQLYEYALFLKSREESAEDIQADEALWDAQFAATSDEAWAKMIEQVRTDIREGKTQSMFGDKGEFVERS
jgi:uncharacterized protein (DUF2147 family)